MRKTNCWLQLFAEEAAEPAPAEAAVQVTEAEPAAPPVHTGYHWAGVERIYRDWLSQADGLRQLYPGFDLRQELRDPRFGCLLRGGADVSMAYYALHSGQIIPAAMQYAARTVEQQMASAMRSGLNRPAENGLQGGSAVSVGRSISNMSGRDIAEICRRVERGERVSFG